MPDRHEYLADLELRARKSLTREAADSLLSEAREHLDLSIQARLELGDAPRDAELQAIAAFGPSGRIVRRESALRRGRRQRPALVAMVLSGSAWLPLALSQNAAWFALSALGFVAAALVFATSCEARRPRRTFAASVAAFWLLSTLLLAVFCGPYYNAPMGRGSLARIADFYQGYAEARIRRQAKYAHAGWPSAELKARTERDRANYAALSAVAREASTAVDLPGSTLWASLATVAYAAYLVLMAFVGAWCERASAQDPRPSRWDYWRPQ